MPGRTICIMTLMVDCLHIQGHPFLRREGILVCVHQPLLPQCYQSALCVACIPCAGALHPTTKSEAPNTGSNLIDAEGEYLHVGILFFDQSPPVPVFAPPHQTICPQEGRGDVATADLPPPPPPKAGVM